MRKGFTLIELLLVVVSIIGVITGALLLRSLSHGNVCEDKKEMCLSEINGKLKNASRECIKYALSCLNNNHNE